MPARPVISTTGVFIAAAIIALAYAWCTDHQWEDYWITFRSAKNLATGNGLVHNPGQRLHSFTSPIGVLTPALGSYITGGGSDIAALWAFRAMSIAAFAGAAALLFLTASRTGLHPLACAFLAAWLLTDNKSQDFSANGMETPFLQLFIAYALWSLFACRAEKRWLHLGLAWGGLMWTRPDSFVYISAISLGVLLFKDRSAGGLTRAEWFRHLWKAALVCTVVYLPWFITAWVYYGTPVPHTITAKASVAGDKHVWEAVWAAIKLPFVSLFRHGPLDLALSPSNANFGAWPLAMHVACRILGIVAYLAWLIPWLRREARIASFIFAIFAAYLDYYPAYPASWYVPAAAWLALFTLACLLHEALLRWPSSGLRWMQRPAVIAASLLVVFGIWMSLHSGRLFATQQKIVDGGNRRDIGLWLRKNAREGDTVFMECLGYIGYFSGLRTYDWPGMSSPEVVKASAECDHNWQHIVAKLKPDWIVLRPSEAVQVLHGGIAEKDGRYELAQTFDVTGKLENLDLYGEALLAFDSCFFVFRRVPNDS